MPGSGHGKQASQHTNSMASSLACSWPAVFMPSIVVLLLPRTQPALHGGAHRLPGLPVLRTVPPAVPVGCGWWPVRLHGVHVTGQVMRKGRDYCVLWTFLCFKPCPDVRTSPHKHVHLTTGTTPQPSCPGAHGPPPAAANWHGSAQQRETGRSGALRAWAPC